MRCPVCSSIKINKFFKNSDFDLFRCSLCKVVFLQSGIKEVYDENYFRNRLKKLYQNCRYDYDPNLYPVPQYMSILKRIKESGISGRLLDIGCGMGVFLDLARREGFETIGVDTSDYAIRYAKKHFSLNVICTDILDIDLPEKSFDVVTMIDSIEHIYQPAPTLRKIRNLLKDGGPLIIATPNEEGLINKLSYAIYRLSMGRTRFLVRSNHGPSHQFYFSLKSLDYLLQKTGFKIYNYYYHQIDPALMDYAPLVTSYARVIFYFAKLLRRQHKMVVFAK